LCIWGVGVVRAILAWTQLTHEEGTLPGDLETQLEELYDELSLSGPMMPEPAPDVTSPPSNVHGSGLPEQSLPSPADPPQQLGPAVMSPAPPATAFENSKVPRPYFEGPKQPGPVVLPASPEPCVPSPADPAKHLLGPAVMGPAPATVPTKLCLDGPTLPRPVPLPTPAEAPLPSPAADPAEHMGPAVMGPQPTAVPAKLCLEGPALPRPVPLPTPAEAPLPSPADPAEHLGPAVMGPAPTAVPAKLCLGAPTLPRPVLLPTPAEAPLPSPADPPQHLQGDPAWIGPATAAALQHPKVPAKAEGPTPGPIVLLATAEACLPSPASCAAGGLGPLCLPRPADPAQQLGPAIMGSAPASLENSDVPAKPCPECPKLPGPVLLSASTDALCLPSLAEDPARPCPDKDPLSRPGLALAPTEETTPQPAFRVTPPASEIAEDNPSPPNPLGKDPCAAVANLQGPMDL